MSEIDPVTDAVRSVLGEFVSPEKAHALADALQSILAGQSSAEVARLRTLLERAGKALSFYSDGFKPRLNKRYGGLEYNPTEDLLRDCGNRAMTVVREIEEAIGNERP